MRLNFQEKLYFWKTNFLICLRKPQNCPPPEKKRKKKPKHLKCSLTRAKTKAIKELTPPFSFFLSLSVSLSLSVHPTRWPWYRSGTLIKILLKLVIIQSFICWNSMHTLEVIPFPEVFFTEVSKFILLNCSFKNAHIWFKIIISYVFTILCSYMKYTIFLIYVDIFSS